MTVCKVCGKPLTDPVSVALQMGPVCRMDSKNATHGQQNLFFMRSNYSVNDKNAGVLIIYDNDRGGKSVTNDIENVLAELISSHGNIASYKIMYKDSQGVFDGVQVNAQGGFESFFPIHEFDEAKALQKLRDRNQKIDEK